MKAEIIKQIIETQCQDDELIVLKGFSPSLIQQLGTSFTLLDAYVIKEGKIDLEAVNENTLLMSILGYHSSTKALCTCESLIKMCTQITGLNILQKKICVLTNNLFDLYPNPTHTDIPDFDSDAFMDTESESALYSVFYSFCIHEGNEQRVQYIDNYSDANDCIRIQSLFEPLPYALAGSITSTDGIQVLSTKDESLNRISKELYNQRSLSQTAFAVEAEEVEEERIRAFVQAASHLGNPVRLYKLCRNLNVPPREELTTLLQRVWGYPSFRDLHIYKDLNINHETTSISQGSVIETVIQQAEHAYLLENEEINNILLTAPTGAGKSLLFQLAAIYLAERYGLLTLIVSPLVALMNDQVDGLSGYEGVAALNSNKSASEKEAILQGVREGTIHLLYLAPELLLSYSITTFLGERKLGLLVVDEAHTVTTWGRDFRVDYWFLGDYLRKAKRILKYTFPIFALTATAVWDPKGRNDMVFDTIRSLNMDPCIKFIGVVRRNNIAFEISPSNITQNYEEKRKGKTIERIREALQAHRKTIVYFPFRRTVDSIYLSDDVADIQDKLARYHAALFPEEKMLNAEAFRIGTKPIMCATKAFGMGIDVSDIREVYHHAPTGCLSDYVQEIGRLARDPQLKGIAKIDFSEYDFRYIRQLHGLSAIKPYQLMQVLQKLMALYRINGEKRNMLISAADFSYIFPLSGPDAIDQNLKSSLLLISNDLLNKLRFHSLIVRPKSLFSKCFVSVPSEQANLFQRLYHPYLKKLDAGTYQLDADRYWTEKHSQISFPMFKAKLAEGKIFKDFSVELKNRVTLSLYKGVEETLHSIKEFFQLAHPFLDEMSSSHHRIEISAMKTKLPQYFDSIKREQFIETFRMLYASAQGLGSESAAFCRVYTPRKNQESHKEAFQLMEGGYEKVENLYLTTFRSQVKQIDMCVYCNANHPLVKLCEFLNSWGIADYQRQGGEQPAIFVRINNPYYLNMLIRKKRYENNLLKSIYEKYQYSERIFTYFFTTPMSDKQRWDFIEAYFLGASEDELLHFI